MSPALFVAIVTVSSVAALYGYLYYLPYYSVVMNQMHVAGAAVLAWASLCMVMAQARGKPRVSHRVVATSPLPRRLSARCVPSSSCHPPSSTPRLLSASPCHPPSSTLRLLSASSCGCVSTSSSSEPSLIVTVRCVVCAVRAGRSGGIHVCYRDAAGSAARHGLGHAAIPQHPSREAAYESVPGMRARVCVC
jgi:hypothetical protein